MSYPNLSAPTTCQMEITTLCSHNCLHCYNFWRGDLPKQIERTLTAEEVVTIMRKLSDAKVFDITFTGGEPLMAFDILKLSIQEAISGGINVHLNSNLLPLTERKARELRELGLKGVVTSLMGPDAETYNMIAQHPNAFNRVVKNIKIAQDAGLNVIANMVVTKVNLHQVKDTARFAHSLGIHKFSATKASCPGNCADFSEYALTLEEFRSYLRDLSDVGSELGINIDALEGCALCGVKDLDVHNFAAHRRCTAGINSMTIGSDGSVRPCSHFDVPYGNLLAEDLSTVWGRMSDWRAGTFLPTGCKSCRLLGVCGGGCRMDAKVCCGDPSAPDPYCVPEDAEFALKSLQVHLERHQGSVHSIGDDGWFTILPHRSREEPFGMTARVSGQPYTYMDQTGMKIFRQMQVGVVYQVGDARIQWGTMNPLNFVKGLIARGTAEIDRSKQ